MSRAFFRCVICGKHGEGEADPDGSPLRGTPHGWVSFLAFYWPPGTRDPGPLLLRICGGCYVRTLTATH